MLLYFSLMSIYLLFVCYLLTGFEQSRTYGEFIFAAGDCANIISADRRSDIRSAYLAEHQGHLCAYNVSTYLHTATVGSNKQQLRRFPMDEFGFNRSPLMVLVSLGMYVYSNSIDVNEYCTCCYAL